MTDTTIVLRRAREGDRVVQAMVAESTRDRWLGDVAESRRLTQVVGMYVDGEMVGFAIPRRDSDGRYRTGAIYISPRYRQRGYAQQYLLSYFAGGKRGRAYIEQGNVASQRLFGSVGFRKSGKVLESDGEVFDEWLLERLGIPTALRWIK